MKRLIAMLSLALLPAALSSQRPAKERGVPTATSAVTSPDNRIVPGERIGAIRLGMGMDEVQRMLGKPTYTQMDGATWFYRDLNLQISFSGRATPTVNFISASCWSRKPRRVDTVLWKDLEPIKVAFQTARGISLGSSSFDVKRTYADYDYHEDNTGGFIAMRYRSLGLDFNTTADHVVWSINVYPPQ